MQYSIVDYSRIIKDSNYLRFDADFFNKDFLTISNFIKPEWVLLNTISLVADGDHAKFPDNQNHEKRYLRVKDLKDNYISDEDPVYVSKDYFLKQKRSWITQNNILLSIMGSVGDIALTPIMFETCIANRAISIIKEIKIDPEYLFHIRNTTGVSLWMEVSAVFVYTI